MIYDAFVETTGPRLRAGLVAAFGPVVGLDAAAEALAYGWEHWSRVGSMDNPAGYLYRVGQTAGRRATRSPRGFLPRPTVVELPEFEPALIPALERLSDSQRVCVVLVHALGWRIREVAELLEISESSVRTHIGRALQSLQKSLEVTDNVD